MDNRERNVEIAEMLSRLGIQIKTAQLPIGDYIVSKRMCIERKAARDFESSIIDSRLFEQARRMAESFEKSVLIVESSSSGQELSRHVLLGAILKLYSEYGTQVLFSEGPEETAYIMGRLAAREQQEEANDPVIIGRKKAYSRAQWQLLTLGTIPGIGPKLSRNLLLTFKTLRNIANLEIKDLTTAEKIGKKKAESIYSVMNSEYNEEVNANR